MTYRPPSGASNSNYFTALQNEMNHLMTWALEQRQTVMILGDLNMNKCKPNSTDGKVVKDLEDIFDLQCLIKDYTRITPANKTLIDVLLTNRSDLFDITGVVDFGLSDHALIYSFLKPRVKIYPSKIIMFRSFKDLNEDSFKSDVPQAMTNVDLNNISSSNDQYSPWHKEITKVLDRHMPIKKMRVRERDVPYITLEW